MSNVNTPASIGLESPKARGLLAALANLVKPMVYECLASDTPRTQPAAAEIGSASSGQSPENEFVRCLKGFIAETVEECRMAESPSSTYNPNSTNTSPSTALVRVNINIMEDSSRPRVVPAEFRQVFKDILLEKIRTDVSKMPTRLLAFDSTGSQIRLVDNREAALYIVESICAEIDDYSPDFLPALINHFKHDPSGKYLWRNLEYTSRQIIALISKYARYTILSHTWKKATSGEISYQDWPTRQQNPGGYAKIKKFCEASARDHGFRLGWIDTCCINKESSAELDEAIRSMYKWYRNAGLCLVYLSETTSQENMSQDSWFTRGWTLQELVAPRRMAVYNKNWTILTCSHKTIAAAVGIQAFEILYFNSGYQKEIPISRRLQMSCGRQVTREEDTAYSLMGILDVSMPIAYGEGSRRAFSRLMREVINSKRCIMDIFNRGYTWRNTNIIPSSLNVYQHRSDVFQLKLQDATPIEPFLLTHMGLRIHLLLVPGTKRNVLNTPFHPMGDLYGEVWDFFLLAKSVIYDPDSDKSVIYEPDDDKSVISEPVDDESFVSEPDDVEFKVIVFGVINFSITNGNVCIQNPSISVPLAFTGSSSMQTESYRMCDRSYLVKPTSPPIFALKSSKDPEGQSPEITIPEDELESHGLRIKMLYL